MDRSFVADNNSQRARLKALVQRLSDEQLHRPMAEGWTVAGVLAHMAFWDARAAFLVTKWESGIAPSEADNEPNDIQWVNDSGKLLFLALPPRIAAELCVRMAEEADRKVEGLSDDLLAKILAAGQPLNLSRATHRREHLDDIERYV